MTLSGNSRMLVLCGMMAFFTLGSAAAAEEPGQTWQVFPETERRAMLTAYHQRMSAPRLLEAADLEAWETRRGELRRRILAGFGLEPPPAQVPLNLTWGDKLEREECTIWRVRFQTFPGLYALGFLYMPKQASFPAPAVLHPHGHWANWSAEDLVQARCLGLARRGYVSLVIQYEHFHDLNIGLPMRGVFLWNNLRGLDLLQSLPEVDPERLGVTGASGGGLQAMDLAAADERVKCAVIGVYPTYYQRILYRHALGCFCNYAPWGALTYTDQQQYLALIAPRPAAVFTVTGDWTAPSLDAEMQEVAAVYDLYPNPPGPELTAVTEGEYRLQTSGTGRFLAERWPGPHDYTQAMRERMYWWMDWWLKGERLPEPAPEEDLGLSPVSALTGLRAAAPDGGHQWADRNLAAIMRPGRVAEPPKLESAEQVAGLQESLRARLAELLGESGRECGGTPESASLGREEWEQATVERLWYASEPDVKIPACLVRPAGVGAERLPVTILLLPNGKTDLLVEPYRSECRERLAQGRAVLAMDWRLRGEWAWEMAPPGETPGITWLGNSLVWGRPEMGMAVCDVRSAVDYLAAREDCDLEDLQVLGMGDTAGFAALLSAALEERIAAAECDLGHSDFGRGPHAPVLPFILRYGDVGEVAALVAPRRLRLRNVNPRTSLNTAEQSYALRGAGPQLRVERLEEGGQREVAIPNGGFEEGDRGWTVAEGALAVEAGEADLGERYLRVQPGQTVLSEPIAVQPWKEYRLYAHLQKSQPPVLEVFLQRGDTRFLLSSDSTDRMSWEQCSWDFVARPGESSVQIGFRVPDANAPGGARVDTVRLVEGERLEPLPPDGRELLSITDFEGIPAGPFEPSRRWEAGKWCMGYGPGATLEIAEREAGGAVLHLASGPGGAYAALSALLHEPPRRGGMYRFTAVVSGRGSLGMNFWAIPPYLTPRAQFELSEEPRPYELDFFVESDLQVRAVPTLSITGEAVIERMSMRAIAAE